jgi:hypothetical protein
MINRLKQLAQLFLIAVCLVAFMNIVPNLLVSRETLLRSRQKFIDEENRDRIAHHKPLLPNLV